MAHAKGLAPKSGKSTIGTVTPSAGIPVPPAADLSKSPSGLEIPSLVESLTIAQASLDTALVLLRERLSPVCAAGISAGVLVSQPDMTGYGTPEKARSALGQALEARIESMRATTDELKALTDSLVI